MKLNKSIVVLTLSLLVGIIFFSLFQKYQELNRKNVDAIQSIPISAAIVIESENWNSSLQELEKTTIWKSITNSEDWSKIFKSIQSLSQKFLASQELKHFINNKKLYLSIHHSTNDFYIFLSTSCNIKDFQSIKMADSLIENFRTRQYDEVEIFEFDNNWNICHHNNILFMSSSSLLIEDGIRQLNNEVSLLDNSKFKKIQSTKSTFAKTHIYTNYANLAKLLYQNTKLSKSQEKWISRWANWAEVDLEISDNNLTLSGFTLIQDSSSNYLTSLFDQQEQKIEISKVAPTNTYTIKAIGIDNINLFYNNYKNFLAKHNNLYEHNKNLFEIKSKYNLDLENYFNGIVLNEIGTISTYSSTRKFDNFIFVKSKQESEELLNYINPKKANKPFHENYRGFKISKFEINNIFSKLYGQIFDVIDENYFSYIDGYLIFANSASSLKTFINNFISKKVLDNNPSFINFKDQIGSRCNFLYYNNPSTLNWEQLLKKKLMPLISKKNWSKVSGFVYQLSSKNELFYNNIVLQYDLNADKASQLDWLVNFDNNISISPQIVYNHKNKKNNIIVQDENKIIYLISSNGNILWKRSLGGIILDDINQIDFYKNQKIQYVFNTEDSLYIIDRLGRNVEDFPIKLSVKAKRGHTLIDYDKNRKYRILVPSENGMVHNYTKEGRIIKGWKFSKMDSPIKQQIKYTSVKGKDYIYVVDKKGNTNIVGRNGKKRVNIKNIPIKSSFYIDKQNGSIYSCDKSGNIWLTTLKGKQTKIKTSELENFSFFATNINDDEIMDLFISNNSSVKCYNFEAEILEFDIQNESTPKHFKLNNKSIIGFSSKGNCYLYNSNGELFSDSPLFGGGEFEFADLDNDNKINLIVINDRILYNYSLK
ncbi:MAG: hypothetical protein CMP70_03070 [Flavobacteriales bacterium]|nr:hypothetical protein [Flavobacteriales bacterium]